MKTPPSFSAINNIVNQDSFRSLTRMVFDPDTRHIIELVYGYDMSGSEVVKEMGVSEATVSNKRKKGLETIKRRFCPLR